MVGSMYFLQKCGLALPGCLAVKLFPTLGWEMVQDMLLINQCQGLLHNYCELTNNAVPKVMHKSM
jgi:hypothetical protein